MICSCQIDSGHIIVFPGGIFLFLVFWAFLDFVFFALMFQSLPPEIHFVL